MERQDDNEGSTRTDNVRVAESDVSIIFCYLLPQEGHLFLPHFDYCAESAEAKFDIEDTGVKLINSSLIIDTITSSSSPYFRNFISARSKPCLMVYGNFIMF